MTCFDLVVIGSGPAGGSTALHAAKLGLSVLILEEHPMAGEPVHCGECLSQVACDRMGWKLPDEAVSLPVRGVRVIFPGNVSTKLTEEGYVLEKHKWEQWIVSQAESFGAKVQYGKKVTHIKKENGQWIVVCADQTTYAARLLVDATGVTALLSRLLDLNERFKTVIGIQYEMADIPTDGYMDFYIWPDLAPAGYLWMIPKSGGRANVGLVTDQNIKAKIFLDQFVARMGWTKKTVAKTFGGMIPASGPLPKTYDDGVLLVGDAAGFTSPLFEGGSHLSLMSGRFAAQVAKEALDKNDPSKTTLSKYETLWKAEFPDYAKIIGGKHALYGFSDEELKVVGSLMPPELAQISITQKIGFGAGVLAKNPALFAKGLTSALAAFGYSRADYYGW